MSDNLRYYDAASSLFCVHDVNKIIVTINRDGTLTYGPDYNPDEAAKTFWNAMLNNNAVVALQLEAERLRAENEKLRDEVKAAYSICDGYALENQQFYDKIDALHSENEKLRAALKQLNAAIDDFWNDKTRPSIARMNEKTLLKVEAAQRDAKVTLEGE